MIDRLDSRWCRNEFVNWSRSRRGTNNNPLSAISCANSFRANSFERVHRDVWRRKPGGGKSEVSQLVLLRGKRNRRGRRVRRARKVFFPRWRRRFYYTVIVHRTEYLSSPFCRELSLLLDLLLRRARRPLLSLSIFTWARVVHASSTPTRNVTSSRVFHRVDIEDLSDNVHRWPDKMTKWWNESKRGGGDIYLILKNRSNIDNHINICPFHVPEARLPFSSTNAEALSKICFPPPPLLFFARFFPAVSFPRFVTYPISRSTIDETSRGEGGRAR